MIGKYERDEASPSIDAAKKLAGFLGTSIGYLLGETEEDDLLKDPKMIRRLKELNGFSDEEKDQVLFTLDAMIREIKNRKEYAA